MQPLEAPIYLIHDDRRALRSMQRVLRSTLHPVVVTDHLNGGSPAIAVVSAERYADVADELTSRGITCLVVADAPREVAAALVEQGAVTHLIASPMPALHEELVTSALKLLSRDLFGLEKYVAWGTPVRELVLSSTLDRRRAVDELQLALDDLGIPSRLQRQAMLICDELLSNAVHNAPIDEHGASYLRERSRDLDLPLHGRERPRLRWGADARYLAIEVTDRYGTLEPRDAISYVAKSRRRDSAVRMDTAGAGLGLAMAYAASNQLVINLAPGVSTQVIGLIDLRVEPQGTSPACASFHVFEERPHA